MTSFEIPNRLVGRFRSQGLGAEPLIFQHGLGGSLEQPLDLLGPEFPATVVSMDFRGHGPVRSEQLLDNVSFEVLAEDLVALLDVIELQHAWIGGISMGSGVALNLALRCPARVKGLILCRPAWLDKPLPANLKLFPIIADLLNAEGAEAGTRILQTNADFQTIAKNAPECALSLLKQFTRAYALEHSTILRRLPFDCPFSDLERCNEIVVPTLVIGNRVDPVHPWEFAERLNSAIPAASLVEVPSKSVSVNAHEQGVRDSIAQFLQQHSKAVL